MEKQEVNQVLLATPVAVLTLDLVKKMLPSQAPEELAKTLLKLNDRNKIEDVARKLVPLSSIPYALNVFKNENISNALVENPELIVKSIADMARIVKTRFRGPKTEENQAYLMLFYTLRNDNVSVAFASHPEKFVDMTRAVGPQAGDIFSILDDKKLAELFNKQPKAFAEIMSTVTSSIDGIQTFNILKDDAIAELFIRSPAFILGVMRLETNERDKMLEQLRKGEAVYKNIIVTAVSKDVVAIEMGRKLDELHDEREKRMAFLASFSKEEIVGMLCSNPQLFYTSSNHLMFDKVKAEIGKKGLEYLKETYGLNNEQLSNFVFRAIGYKRLGDFISDKGDVSIAMDLIRGKREDRSGIYSEFFDDKYFYLVANGIEAMAKYAPTLVSDIKGRIEELQKQRSSGEENVLSALMYLNYMLTKKAGSDESLKAVAKGSVFNRANYMGKDGKFTVVQIFDKEDTENDHWKAGISFFRRQFGKEPVTGEAGELIFEKGSSRVVLFMGNEKEDNVAFIKNWIKNHDSGAITFRGHSYHLAANMPPEIFGNKSGKYVFIPGSCGSASSVPEYIAANPKTQLRFFSNTSTGRGNVTNVLVGLLLTQTQPSEFTAILNKGSRMIKIAGGNTDEIKAFNPGEALLEYVNKSQSDRMLAMK